METVTSWRAVGARRLSIIASAVLPIMVVSSAFAQQPATPPDADPGTWIGTAGAGLALTSGNSDTLNVNVAFDATRDPKTRNVMKWTGLYLRGEQNDALAANRLSLAFRDQYALTTRAYTFGQIDHLRDTFKLIDYLVAPTAGVWYKLVILIVGVIATLAKESESSATSSKSFKDALQQGLARASKTP